MRMIPSYDRLERPRCAWLLIRAGLVPVVACHWLCLCSATPGADGIQRILPRPPQGTAHAVVVSGRELVHTTQLLPVDQHGELVGAGDPQTQIDRVLNQLVDVLAAQQARPDGIVKLNMYVTDASIVRALLTAVELRFGRNAPAVSLVTTKLPVAGALLALDAVAAREATAAASGLRLRREPTIAGPDGIAHSAVLPIGETIYISGQAEPGSDLREATANTLAGLRRTLEHLQLGPEQVVQLKCFLTPMASAELTYDEIRRMYADGIAPPVSVVEWISSAPVEIEMIVHAPESAAGVGVTHEWLPWLTDSPVFCRLARVRGDTQIYVAACFGDPRKDEAGQVADVFRVLEDRLKAAGSDLAHMAKATYYVVNEQASRQVNEIRPTLYDPQHPPAASKALVYGAGPHGATVTLDMIAVPAGE